MNQDKYMLSPNKKSAHNAAPLAPPWYKNTPFVSIILRSDLSWYGNPCPASAACSVVSARRQDPRGVFCRLNSLVFLLSSPKRVLSVPRLVQVRSVVGELSSVTFRALGSCRVHLFLRVADAPVSLAQVSSCVLCVRHFQFSECVRSTGVMFFFLFF